MKEQEKLEEFINSQPKLGTKEFNDLASAYFGGNPKQECEHIKEYGCIKDICSCNTNPKKAPFKHKIQSIPKEEILENRSNAYEFIDFDKQETLEEVRKVERTELFNSILSIVKQIPRKDIDGDAMDAPSCAYEIEQLFYKWQQEQQDEFAIEFAKWCAELKVWDNETYVNNTFEELLQQFKNK